MRSVLLTGSPRACCSVCSPRGHLIMVCDISHFASFPLHSFHFSFGFIYLPHVFSYHFPTFLPFHLFTTHILLFITVIRLFVHFGVPHAFLTPRSSVSRSRLRFSFFCVRSFLHVSLRFLLWFGFLYVCPLTLSFVCRSLVIMGSSVAGLRVPLWLRGLRCVSSLSFSVVPSGDDFVALITSDSAFLPYVVYVALRPRSPVCLISSVPVLVRSLWFSLTLERWFRRGAVRSFGVGALDGLSHSALLHLSSSPLLSGFW